jgi:hypothetical protein
VPRCKLDNFLFSKKFNSLTALGLRFVCFRLQREKAAEFDASVTAFMRSAH